MLRAAAQVFGERGYHRASMDEIAARAGITKPMLYSYFDSKEGLFAACEELRRCAISRPTSDFGGGS